MIKVVNSYPQNNTNTYVHLFLSWFNSMCTQSPMPSCGKNLPGMLEAIRNHGIFKSKTVGRKGAGGVIPKVIRYNISSSSLGLRYGTL